LREKGVPEGDMSDALDLARMQDLEAAHTVWQKKFGELALDSAERARQYRFLASRGFPTEVIRRVIGGLDDE
jgi:regulatory protein